VAIDVVPAAGRIWSEVSELERHPVSANRHMRRQSPKPRGWIHLTSLDLWRTVREGRFLCGVDVVEAL
jgi:hypothetical protein